MCPRGISFHREGSRGILEEEEEEEEALKRRIRDLMIQSLLTWLLLMCWS